MEEEGKGYHKKVDQIMSEILQWSYEVMGLRKQIKNFRIFCSLLFGENSAQARNFHSLNKHILDNEQFYDDYCS